jgi:hypothetical protein
MSRWPWSGPPPSDDARVRAALLPRTLERAAQLPYYRQSWGNRWRRGLTALPVLRKAEAVQHQRGLLLPGLDPFVGVVSSGTQHGDRAPLRVPETEDELEAFGEFARGRSIARAPAPRGLALEVLSMQHGFPSGEPHQGVLRVGWSFSETTLKVIRELLLSRDGKRRVETLVIGAGALPALTAWLYEQDFDFRKLAVQDIGTTGFALSPHWKARVEALWGARVWNNFSLSEFAAPAPECEHCGFHHWLWPANLTEVLHPTTGAPLSRGVGELVVTTLFPFVQAMPLIRYATGDLVELGPACHAARERGFRMRGRLAQCVLSHRGDLVASPLDVEAFLDGLPDVDRLPHPDAKLGLVKSVDVGVPRFELDAAKGRARVRFEVRFDPALFPQRADALEKGLARHLRAPALEATAVRRGTLKRKWTKF